MRQQDWLEAQRGRSGGGTFATGCVMGGQSQEEGDITGASPCRYKSWVGWETKGWVRASCWEGDNNTSVLCAGSTSPLLSLRIALLRFIAQCNHHSSPVLEYSLWGMNSSTWSRRLPSSPGGICPSLTSVILCVLQGPTSRASAYQVKRGWFSSSWHCEPRTLHKPREPKEFTSRPTAAFSWRTCSRLPYFPQALGWAGKCSGKLLQLCPSAFSRGDSDPLCGFSPTSLSLCSEEANAARSWWVWIFLASRKPRFELFRAQEC